MSENKSLQFIQNHNHNYDADSWLVYIYDGDQIRRMMTDKEIITEVNCLSYENVWVVSYDNISSKNNWW